MTPCATCRHEVDHLIALDIEINAFRAKARDRRGLHGLRGLDVRRFFSDIKAARKATERHRQHRRDEHDAIHTLAEHLPEHANERRAAA